MIMKNVRNKNTIATIILILVLTFSTVAVVIPNVAAQKTTFGMAIMLYPNMGVNSPAMFSLIPDADPEGRIAYGSRDVHRTEVLFNPPYVGQDYIWPDAVVTFTRPDSTTDVINGPFKQRSSTVQGRYPDLKLVYAPDMMGNWNINFYWPGDDNYNAVNNTYPFTVGEHYPKRETFAKLSMRPYPAVGLGQDVLINAWVTPPPFTDQDFYENYTFTFTSSSGSSFTVGPMNSEAPGTVWFNLPLTEIGEWTIKLDFPGDHLSLPSSVTRTITVQEDPVTIGYPDTPLPTEEWTFPIHTQNREWRNIAGPWYQRYYDPSMSAYNPYTEAPRTAHVLWKISSLDLGAQPGGYMGSPHSIETGGGQSMYDPGDAGLFSSTTPTIYTVMAGRGYFTAGGQIHCVDMRTGDELWAVDGSFNVGSRRGRTAVLYSFGGTSFIAYDAMTGNKILDVPGMRVSFYRDPYCYSTVTGPERGIPGNLQVIKWDTSGSSSDFASRVVWNISSPYDLYVPWSLMLADDYLLNFAFEYPTSLGFNMAAWNLTTGELVYDVPVWTTDPDTWVVHLTPMGTGQGTAWVGASPVENEGIGYVAFDINTGERIWDMEPPGDPWGNFWAYTPQANAYGMIYGLSYSGVYAMNVTNGDIVWHYIAEDTYSETPYGSNIDPDTGEIYASYPFGSTGAVVGGGMVFAPNTEHSPTFVYRGMQLHALDAFTGEEVWSIKGFYTPSAIAYGTLLASDSYNGFTYAFGKGTTETTISTSSKVIAKGESILLEGTVLDMSPAQKGTAAVSDTSQTTWMEYLHMQQPCPENAEGVEVVITTLDPNGNTYELSRTTTSALSGTYGCAINPPVPGVYKIIATFEGSDAYYRSYAETYIIVEEAPSAAQPIEPEPVAPAPAEPTSTEPAQPAAAFAPTEPMPAEPTQAAEAPLVTTEIAIIAAVAIAVVIGTVSFYKL